MSIELYPHNQETYNKIQEMWKTTNRVAAVQATGTGKSFLILKCLFDIPNEKKVVLSPSTYIFEQLIEHSEEIIPNVEFITYSKIANMTDEEIQALNPKLIVLDEFHRCGAEQWGKGVQKLLEIYSNTKVLGTSATPIRYLDNERDMSDELFDGNVAVNLGLAEAIVKGILPMPKYVSALYTFEEEINNLKNKVINSYNSEEEKKELLKKINILKNKLNKSKGIPQILKKHLFNNNGKFIVFCKNTNHLDEMKPIVINWFKSIGIQNVNTYMVYSGYKNTDIEFETFKNDNNNNSIKLLFSIEMLNEGVHVSNIDGVILLRPTTSPIIYYQQIGRAIDAGSNNKKPLIFDFVNNFDNIGAKQFINDLKEFKKKEVYARKEYEDKEDIDVFEFNIYDEIIEIKELFNNIEDKLFNREDHWLNIFNILIDYKQVYGDLLVKADCIYKNVPLGNWVMAQRRQFNNNILSESRIKLLTKIGFIWDVDKHVWNEIYLELKDYKEKFGSIIVDANYLTKFGTKLYAWIQHQRRFYKDGSLDSDKIKKLESLGLKLDNLNQFDQWNKMFNILVDYKNEYGNCLVNSKLVYKNESLGRWVSTQRNKYKNNQLTKEKISKLNEIEFVWSIFNK